MPEQPAEVALDEVSADWLAARRREQARLDRPARVGLVASLTVAAAACACLLAGMASNMLAAAFLALAGASAVLAAAISGRLIWRGNRELAQAVQAEEDRITAFRAAQRRELTARQQQHVRDYRDWQRRSVACQRQPGWHPVTLGAGVHRVDVAGGTLAGWSALLTTLAAARLASGGEVTVLDLTEGGVAADLVALAGRLGLEPLVWVLPADLPTLDLGTGLDRDGLADLLALTVAATDSYGRITTGPATAATDPARDAALLRMVLEVLGEDATMAQLTAALRALAQIGGPAEHLRGVRGVVPPGEQLRGVVPQGQQSSGELWQDQLSKLAGLFGRGGERLVIDRALAMEARLRTLAPLASALAARNPSRLKVAWLDRRAPSVGNSIIGCYLAVALTAMLRQAPAAERWRQTICLLGAERLAGDVIDRLCDAAEAVGTGLVLGYRSIPPHVRERLGRGDTAVAFMRLGNADDARLAAEQIGTEHRFVVSQLTDTVGASVTDTVGDSYSSTLGTADSISDSRSLTVSAGRSRGRGRSRPSTFAPFADFTGSVSRDASSSVALADSRSVTEGINASTSWGLTTSRALGLSDSLAASAQRSREFLVEAAELQHLPHTAVVLSHSGPAGRRVLLADANPGIMTLKEATLTPNPEA